MFSSGSFRSISLATVTPSLVMVGDPNFVSRMTFRPRGPSVTLTAFARLFTPRRIPCREASPYTICFAITAFNLYGMDLSSARPGTARPKIDGNCTRASEQSEQPQQQTHQH